MLSIGPPLRTTTLAGNLEPRPRPTSTSGQSLLTSHERSLSWVRSHDIHEAEYFRDHLNHKPAKIPCGLAFLTQGTKSGFGRSLNQFKSPPIARSNRCSTDHSLRRMPKRIAILGASGAVGSALAVHILRARLLEPADQLWLVGHGEPASERRLLSMRVDLLDAFDDQRVQIEVAPDIPGVEADIVLVAAGTRFSSRAPSRRDFGATNRAIFERIADQCIPRLSRALFIVVSNPVELAVKILSFAIDRERVIGMGAQQDSLRFARAIAVDLEISRHDVRASVLGEHGPGMIPLWRSVELVQDNSPTAGRLAGLRAKAAESPFEERVAGLFSAVQHLVSMDRVAEAYQLTRKALPDARIVVEPYITFHSLRSTPNATANAAVQVIAAALANDRRRIHGQVDLRGEVAGLHGVCGVPATIGMDGWRPEPLDWLTPEEIRAIHKSADSIEEFISGTLIDAVRATLTPEALMSLDLIAGR
jgi:malate dehydrogenase